jgi:hypothetical protein
MNSYLNEINYIIRKLVIAAILCLSYNGVYRQSKMSIPAVAVVNKAESINLGRKERE